MPGQEDRGDQTDEYMVAFEAARKWILENHPPKTEPAGETKPKQLGLF